MEEIRRAAGAYYENLPENNKELAKNTFDAMDKNGDGKISVREYVEYLSENKATDFIHQSIFSALDMDGNGSLDFDEVIVLYYLMQSGRAIICQSCKTYLAGAYFSCSQCFLNVSNSTYEICCECYGGKKFTHHCDAIFCDNYTLLRQSRSVIQETPIKAVKSLRHRRQRSFTILQIEDDINNNQRAHNGPADGLNQKDLLRKMFYAMNLLLEIATAVLDYVSSQQRQPRYALSSMILSITVLAISLIQLAYTGRKEEVSWQWKGWIPWFYHRDPSNKLFGNPVQIVELFFSVSQCVFAIIAYHYLSRDQNNPTQFSVYPVVFAFFLLCLSFRRREPRVKVSEKS